MLKRTSLVSTLVALAVSGSTAVCLGASWHGGGFGLGAVPESVVPASADVYVGLNLGGAQGATLAQLWTSYQSHPGTARALANLRAALGAASVLQASRVLSSLGDRAGLAVWAPSGNSPRAQPRVAIVAQLKASTFFPSGIGPLPGVAGFVPTASYQGTTVYRVVFKDGSTTYGEVVAGDGVLATDLRTAERVIDAATFHAPSLAASADFVAATAQLPVPRALTLYVTPRFLLRAERAARTANGGMPGLPPMLVGALQRPYAVAVVAAPDGLSIVSSVQQVPPGLLHPTPNEGAGVVGSNAVLYASLDDLAATLATPGVLPARVLIRIQVLTGIDVQRDILPLVSHEVVVDVNDEVSDVLMAASAASIAGAQRIPALPGSIELATWVDDPVAAERTLARIAAAIARLAQLQGQAPSGAPPVVKTTLPDGSVAYRITALRGLSYTVRGHWLLLSTSLSADIGAARVALAADAAYQAALAHVAGPGPLLGMEYINVTRLLRVVHAWLTFVQAQPRSGLAPSTFSTWQQIEPLIAPLRSIVAATRQIGANGEQAQTFITIKP